MSIFDAGATLIGGLLGLMILAVAIWLLLNVYFEEFERRK